MQTAHWRELRQLFDAVCDLPPERWKERLREISDDPALIDEALSLLEAQTASFNRALQPLGELMASLSETELQAGDRLGSWLLVERLASGGMGTVFVAERADELFRQRVAIKLLRSGVADPATAARLAAERQILAELQHPDIARLYDGGTTPRGQPYLVMEYVAGLPLDRHCTERKLGLRDRLQLFLRVCRAVQAAHQRLIVHCDLKPSNVLVRENGEPVLLDFGIARLLGEGESGDAGGFCTPAYASPELLGAARVGVASDVFSLGVLLTELLADRRADRGTADRERPVPLPSALAGADCTWKRRLRGDLDAIAGRACALDPARRYSSVEALTLDIERYLVHRPVDARAPSMRYRLGRWLRRRWREAAVAAAAMLLTSGFVWRLIEERAWAEREAAVAQQVSDFLVEMFEAADPRVLGSSGTEDVTARQVLDASAAKIGSGGLESPAVLARLRFVIGRSYLNLGQSQRAEALLKQAIDAFVSPQVNQPELAIAAMNELSALLCRHRRGAEAAAVARRALALAQGLGNPDHIAAAHDALGSALRVEGRFDEAERLLNTALEMRRESFGDRGVRTLDSLHNLAVLYEERGDFAHAEQAYRQVIGHLPGRSWDYQLSLAGLAGVIRRQGRHGEAAALLRENLDLAADLYGDDSDKVATAHSNLAAAYRDAGDYQRARGHYRKAVEIARNVNGDHSVNYAIQLNGLASIEEARGDLVVAERLFRQSLAIRRALFPPDDNSVLIAESNLGHVLADMGRLEEAGTLLESAMRGWRRSDHPNVVAGELNWIEWLLRHGRLGAAQAALASMPIPGKDKSGLVLQHLAATAELAKLRGAPDAHELWRRVVAMSEAQAGTDSVPTAKQRVPYAEALRAAGRPQAAKEQVRLAETPLRRALVPQAALLLRLDAVKAASPDAAQPSAG